MSNPLRKRFSGPDADLHLGTARSLLGSLKNSMSLGNLPAGRMRRTIEGVDYDVMSLFGMDQVSINVPKTNAPRHETEMGETEPVTHELELPAQEFDTIGILWVDVFWFASTVETNDDPYYAAEEEMWFRLRNIILNTFNEVLKPVDLESGRLDVVPRFTVINDRLLMPEFDNYLIGSARQSAIFGKDEGYPRNQRQYAYGMTPLEMSGLGKPHHDALWRKIDVFDWWVPHPTASGLVTDTQKHGAMMGDIGEKLMWLNGRPEMITDDNEDRIMTPPVASVFLGDAGKGLNPTQRIDDYYDEGHRLQKAFTDNAVISAWYNSWAIIHADYEDTLPYGLEGYLGPERTQFFYSKIDSVSEGLTVVSDVLGGSVKRACTWLAERAQKEAVTIAERGYKDKFDAVHSAPVVDWNVDDKRPFDAIPPIPFKE